MHDKRFQKSPPDVVILQGIERNHHGFQPINANQTKGRFGAHLHQGFLSSSGLKALAVAADRLLKWLMYRYSKAAIHRKVGESPYHRIGSKFFFQGEEAFKERSPEYKAQIVQVLEGYKEALEDQGTRFIFLPVPNKENIYHGLFPNQKKPPYLSRLIAALQEKWVEVIDTQTAFDKAFQEGAQLYPCDDAHRNPEGVRITAELVAEALGIDPTETM